MTEKKTRFIVKGKTFWSEDLDYYYKNEIFASTPEFNLDNLKSESELLTGGAKNESRFDEIDKLPWAVEFDENCLHNPGCTCFPM